MTRASNRVHEHVAQSLEKMFLRNAKNHRGRRQATKANAIKRVSIRHICIVFPGCQRLNFEQLLLSSYTRE